MSAPQGLENDPTNTEEFDSIAHHEIIETYGVRIIMQWIPGHYDIPGNKKADTLANTRAAGSGAYEEMNAQ